MENDGKRVSEPLVECQVRSSVITVTCDVLTRFPLLVMVCQAVPSEELGPTHLIECPGVFELSHVIGHLAPVLWQILKLFQQLMLGN